MITNSLAYTEPENNQAPASPNPESYAIQVLLQGRKNATFFIKYSGVNTQNTGGDVGDEVWANSFRFSFFKCPWTSWSKRDWTKHAKEYEERIGVIATQILLVSGTGDIFYCERLSLFESYSA